MSCAWRWGAAVILVAAAALYGAAGQEAPAPRWQVGHNSEVAVGGGGPWGAGRQHQHRRPQVQGEAGGRPMTREERRRLREERRQARKERRRQRQDGRRGEVEGVVGEEPEEEEEVVDLVWLRANLSSLWEEFRAFTRLQVEINDPNGSLITLRTVCVAPHLALMCLSAGGGDARTRAFLPPFANGRAQAGREGGQRTHTGPLQEEEEEGDTCPTDADGCRDAPGGEICNGRGTCHCGHCQCEAEYYGSTCQCSDHTCQRYDGMPCGGPSRGQCRCGECMCRPDYVGEACSCPTHTHSCIHPGQQAVCSNKGVCECGRCSCGDGFKGMYCEDSVYAARVCETLKACVLCKAWGRELTKCDQCQITISVVDMLEPSMTTCVMVNSGCILKYSYVSQAANAYSVLLERNNECPPLIQ